MKLEEYYAQYGSRIAQDSERLFVEEFLYPMLGSKIGEIIPQYPFLEDRSEALRAMPQRGRVLY